MNTVKRKRCKWHKCNKLFTPFKTTQVCCSGICALEYTRKRKEDAKSRMKLFEKEISDNKLLKKSLHATVMAVHNLVKFRDRGKPCISCKNPWHRDFHAGHYYKAELYSSLKFNLKNIHGQCPKCNIFLDGNLNEYSINLPLRIGRDDFEELRRLASIDKHLDFKWDIQLLKSIRTSAQAELKLLKNEKK